MRDDREKTTSEVAAELGIAPDLLRKWKARGFLKLAPAGVSGQGRGVECYWSQAAIDEARAKTTAPKAKGGRPRKHDNITQL